MGIFLNVGSLGLGLFAWSVAGIALIRKSKYRYGMSVCSFSMCVLSLLFQLAQVKYLVEIGDFSAIEDTIDAVVFAAVILTVITIALNMMLYLHRKGEK